MQLFCIVDDVIYLTRGDNAVLEIKTFIQDEDEEEYVLQDGDFYTFTVRKIASNKADVVFSISSYNERIVISHEDTTDAEVGKYSADIQLNLASGERFTVWPAFDVTKPSKEFNYKNFCIMSEVTRI